MLYSIITIDNPEISQMTQYMGQIFVDIWLILVVIVGVQLAFHIIKGIIKLFPSDSITERKKFYRSEAEKWWKEHETTPPIFLEGIKKEKKEVGEYITKLDQWKTRQVVKKRSSL